MVDNPLRNRPLHTQRGVRVLLRREQPSVEVPAKPIRKPKVPAEAPEAAAAPLAFQASREVGRGFGEPDEPDLRHRQDFRFSRHSGGRS